MVRMLPSVSRSSALPAQALNGRHDTAPAMRRLDELEFLSDKTGVASVVPFHIRRRARVLALKVGSAAVQPFTVGTLRSWPEGDGLRC